MRTEGGGWKEDGRRTECGRMEDGRRRMEGGRKEDRMWTDGGWKEDGRRTDKFKMTSLSFKHSMFKILTSRHRLCIYMKYIHI